MFPAASANPARTLAAYFASASRKGGLLTTMRRPTTFRPIFCVAAAAFSPASAWTTPGSSSPLSIKFGASPDSIFTSSLASSPTKMFSSAEGLLELEKGPEKGPVFNIGDRIQVEVDNFGPLGGSVYVIGIGHTANDLIPEEDPPLGQGLVLQKEIQYFRQARDNVDIVIGEILPAYVEFVRDDGKLHISLRPPGGKAKATDVGKMILERLELESNGTLSIGDKSPPQDIQLEFPGVSKGAFKKAVSALYKKGLVKPSPNSISLTK